MHLYRSARHQHQQHPPSRAAVVFAVGPEELLATAGAQEISLSFLAVQTGGEGRLGSALDIQDNSRSGTRRRGKKKGTGDE